MEDGDWRERHREVHHVEGAEAMRLGLVNDGLRELWFPTADFERWVELTRGIAAGRGDGLPAWVLAFDEGRGPFLRRGLRLVMAPAEGRVLPELVPLVAAEEPGRDTGPREVLELAIALFIFAEDTRQEVTLDRL